MKTIKKTIATQGTLTLERWSMPSTRMDGQGNAVRKVQPSWYLCVKGERVSFDLKTKKAGLAKFELEANNLRK